MPIVKVQYTPGCPKCDELIERLMAAGVEYGFEVFPELVDTSFEPFYARDSASKIYNKEWIEKHGTKKQKKLYEEAGFLIDLLGSRSVTPVIEIVWHYGLSERKIVIKGFKKDLSEKGIENLVKTVLLLIGVERSASTPLRVKK